MTKTISGYNHGQLQSSLKEGEKYEVFQVIQHPASLVTTGRDPYTQGVTRGCPARKQYFARVV